LLILFCNVAQQSIAAPLRSSLAKARCGARPRAYPASCGAVLGRLKRALLAGRSATWLRQVRLCLKCYTPLARQLFGGAAIRGGALWIMNK